MPFTNIENGLDDQRRRDHRNQVDQHYVFNEPCNHDGNRPKFAGPEAAIETVEAESQAGEPRPNTLHGQKDCGPQDVSKEAASNLKVDPSFCS